MKALGTEYDILKTSWREVRQLPLEKRSSALLYNRLFILFLGYEDLRSLSVLCQENLGGRNRQYSIDATMEYLIEDLKRTAKPIRGSDKTSYELMDRFILELINSQDGDFDSVFINSCKTNDSPNAFDLVYLLIYLGQVGDPGYSSIAPE